MATDSKLPFTHAEYEDRLRRAAEQVRRRELDLTLVAIPENIFYLTGHDTLGYFALQVVGVPREGQPFMVVREIEADHIADAGVIADLVTYGEREDPLAVLCDAVRKQGFERRRVGIEKDAWFSPLDRVTKMARALGRTEFDDGTGIVEGLRLIKSDQEIEYIRAAAAIADRGFDAGLEAARDGARESDIAAAIYSGLLGAGSDYVGPVYVASGPNTALPHSPWTARVLRAGDLVFLELAGCVHRYHAAMRRTLSVGRPSPDAARAHEACERSRERILELLRPGNVSGEIHDAHDAVLAGAGLRGFLRMKTGYSIGVGYPPGWGEWHIMDLKAGDPRRVQSRMSLHVGTQLVFRKRFGMGLSDTVIVRDGGPEALTSTPARLFEV